MKRSPVEGGSVQTLEPPSVKSPYKPVTLAGHAGPESGTAPNAVVLACSCPLRYKANVPVFDQVTVNIFHAPNATTAVEQIRLPNKLPLEGGEDSSAQTRS